MSNPLQLPCATCGEMLTYTIREKIDDNTYCVDISWHDCARPKRPRAWYIRLWRWLMEAP